MKRGMGSQSRLEVHQHSFVSGRFSNGGGYGRDGTWHTSTFEHSHEGGDQPHEHPDTGPASYTIDKDEWLRATGLRGGGRKRFTTKPTGEQFVLLPREPMTFEVVICAPTPSKGQPGYLGEGPGIALPIRIAKTFKARFHVVDGTARA